MMFRPLGTLSFTQDTLNLIVKNGFQYFEDISKVSEIGKKIVNLEEITKQITPKIVSTLDHWENEVHCERLTTFNKALDSLLGGGFPCKNITEICGAQGTGKTQICFQLCITAQLPLEKGGLNGKVLYIDSRNGFSSKRLKDLIIGCQKDYPDLNIEEDDILEGVSIVTIGGADELFSIIQKLRKYLETKNIIRVIIVDSLSLPVLCTWDETSVKYRFYFRVLEELQNLAFQHNIAVIIVNELITQLDLKGQIGMFSAAGQSVAQRCQKRLMVARLNNTTFAAKVLKSSTIPQISKIFHVTADGIRN